MTEHTITVSNSEQGRAVLDKLWSWMKPRLTEGRRLRLSVAEEVRSPTQNAKLHAMLGEIARQKEWAGQRWDAEVWKRLLTASWMRAHGERITVVPALDGQGVDVVFRRTSSLTRQECSDLIEFTLAWCAQEGVQLSQ